MKDAECAETNEKSNFRFLVFRYGRFCTENMSIFDEYNHFENKIFKNCSLGNFRCAIKYLNILSQIKIMLFDNFLFLYL